MRIGIEPLGARTRSFSAWRTSRWRPVSVPDARETVERALEDDRAAVGPGARPHVDDVVGDPDDLRVVLDDEHGVALVAERRSSAFICSTSWAWSPIVGSSKT